MLVCGLGLPLATFTTVGADDAPVGPVTFTVHAALCPVSVVNDPEIGLYDGCHANAIEGVTFTFESLEGGAISFASGADGVATASILDGAASATQVTFSADDPAGGYAYCSDQNTGTVLYDGTKLEDNAVPLFTVDASQAIVCDWYIYTDEVAAG